MAKRKGIEIKGVGILSEEEATAFARPYGYQSGSAAECVAFLRAIGYELPHKAPSAESTASGSVAFVSGTDPADMVHPE